MIGEWRKARSNRKMGPGLSGRHQCSNFWSKSQFYKITVLLGVLYFPYSWTPAARAKRVAGSLRECLIPIIGDEMSENPAHPRFGLSQDKRIPTSNTRLKPSFTASKVFVILHKSYKFKVVSISKSALFLNMALKSSCHLSGRLTKWIILGMERGPRSGVLQQTREMITSSGADPDKWWLDRHHGSN